VLEHRLVLRPQAAALGRSARDILRDILDQLPPPI
jgi:MoxR-like ATPase